MGDPSPLPPPLVWHSHAGLSICEILVPCCLPARLDPSPGMSMQGCCSAAYALQQEVVDEGRWLLQSMALTRWQGRRTMSIVLVWKDT